MAIQDFAKPIFELPPAQAPDTAPQALQYSSFRFFQVMWAIAWSAFAHPFSTSVIDLTTGSVRHLDEK